jgi:gliding motility-associated-like protein
MKNTRYFFVMFLPFWVFFFGQDNPTEPPPLSSVETTAPLAFPPPPPCNCTLTQGDFSTALPFMSTNSSAVDFYNYGNPTGSSSNTGLELSETFLLMLHEDTNTGNTSLIIILDSENDGTGGEVDLTVNCLPDSAAVAFSDDGGELTGSPPTITGNFTWVGCCTDGGVISGVGCGNTFTINPEIISGIDVFSLVHGTPGSPNYINMPDIQCPITINCGGTSCCDDAFDFSAVTEDPSCETSNNGSIDLLTDCASTPVFQWSNGATTEDITSLLPGPYSVTITDVNGCSQTATYTLTPEDPPQPDITSPSEFCEGDVLVLVLSEAYFNYAWSTGSTNSSLPVNLPGTYSVTVTNTAGCTGTDAITVTQNPVPIVDVYGDYCEGASFYYPSNGQNYAQGTYTITYPLGSYFNCDSIVMLHVTELLNTEEFQEIALCQGDSYNVCGIPYDVENFYSIDCNPNFEGCDSTINLSLFFLNPIAVVDPPETLGCGTNNSVYLNGLNSSFGPNDSYMWETTNGEICDDPTNLFLEICLPGTYCLTVTSTHYYSDGSGIVECTDEVCVTVLSNINSPVTMVSTVDVSCPGDSDGTATIAVDNTQNIGPYSFNWDPNVSVSETAINLLNGIYMVTITAEGNGCTTVESITINAPTEISISTTQQDIACNGDITGSATAMPTGGSGVYSYLWCNNQTTATVSGLSPGPCEVIVIDNNNCASSATVTIQEVTALTGSVVPMNVACNGGNTGSATVTPGGGTPPYTFIWCNSQTGMTATNLTAASCSVTITDDAGCTLVQNTILTEPDPISLSTSQTNVLCNGDMNGTATVSPSGGLAPYTYLWCNNQTTAIATDLGTGLCSVEVTDNNDCTSSVSINIIAPDPLTATATMTDVNCFDGTDGTATVTPSGGTAPYTQVWCNTQTSITATGLSAGPCQVIITDNNDCTAMITVTLSQPTEALDITGTSTDAACGNDDGSINITVSGGTTPYIYNWSDPALDVQNPNGLAPGNYTVTVTDENDCTEVFSIAVNTPSGLEAITVSTPVSCTGGSDGTVSISTTGGLGPYEYDWTGGIPEGSTDATNLSADDYNVTVTDASGCTYVTSATITEPLLITIDGNATDENCGESDGTISLNVQGGTAPYNYDWDLAPDVQNPTGLGAGNYIVIVTDDNDCTATYEIGISTPNELLLTTMFINVTCNGETDGEIDLEVSGGVSPFSYQWTNGAGTEEDPDNLGAGTFTVVVTDNTDCSVTTSVDIIEPAAISLLSTGEEATCGDPNGSISIVVSGGTGPYSYLWSNADDIDNPVDLLPGDYEVTVTDANDCSYIESIEVTEPAPIELNISATMAPCFEEADGSIDLEVVGGTAPFTYSWTGGAIVPDPSNLLAGQYTVVVTDGNDCTETTAITVEQPAAMVVDGSSTVALCGNDNGSISVFTVGGTSPFTYVWTGGAAPVANPMDLGPGTYTTTVTDNNDCTATYSIDVEIPTGLTLTAVATDVLCYGESVGSVNVEVQGGLAPFSYLWDYNGATTEDLADLPAGTYGVVVTDDTGCTIIASVTVEQPEELALSGTILEATCGEANGGISLNVTGGTSPYSYDWDNNAMDIQNPIGLAAGNYIVIVTDNNDCTATYSTIVTTPVELQASATQTDVNCNGGSDGTIDISTTGGTAPFTYLWTNNATDEDPSGLPAGPITGVVTDANGCGAEVNLIIAEPIIIAISGTSLDASCGNTNGSIDLTVTGGTAPYTYDWDTAQDIEDPIDLLAGTYVVTVSDLNGCTGEYTIAVSTPNALALSAITTNAFCNSSNTGSIALSVSGGLSPFSYEWNTGWLGEDLSDVGVGSYTVIVTDATDCSVSLTEVITEPEAIIINGISTDALCGQNDGTITIEIQGGTTPYTYLWTNASTNQNLTDLGIGNFTVIVTDGNQCTAEYSITVNTPNGLSLTEISTDANCNGGTDGSAGVTVVGGTPPFEYTWSNLMNTPDITGLGEGTYSVTVTDADDCMVVSSSVVNEPETISISGTSVQETCGDSNGSINISVIGGTAGYSYLWSNGSMDQNPPGLIAADYTVTVTDANNCTAEMDFTVESPTVLSGSLSPTNVSCNSGQDGTINAVIFGGTGPYSYNWTPQGGTEALAVDLPAGDYVIEVTDASGCTYVLQQLVTEPGAIVIDGSSTDATCGDNNGTITIEPQGGTAPYQYAWSPNGGPVPDPTALGAGSYTVTVTDANQCTEEYGINVNTPNMLEVNGTASEALCAGSSDGSVDITVSGGVGPFTYQWTNGSLIEDVSNVAAGNYSVTVTDATDCTVTALYTVAEPTPISITGNSTQEICGQSNGTITIEIQGGTSPYTYTWTNGSADQNPTDLGAGSFVVTVTDLNACTSIYTQEITTPNGVTLSSTKTDASCFGEANGSIDLTLSGGIAPFTFIWDNNETTEDVNGLLAGTYMVTVTDGNLCTYTFSAVIEQPETLQANTQLPTAINCNGDNDGSIVLTVTGGTTPYSYDWDNALDVQNPTGLGAGDYNVIVTDLNGCTAISSATLTEPLALVLSTISNATDCNNSADGEIDLTVIGGTTPYTYVWNNASTNEDPTGLAAGLYDVVVTDDNGCTETISAPVEAPEAIILSISNVSEFNGFNVSCADFDDGSVTVEASGGVLPFNYVWSNGATGATADNLMAGTYFVTASDANGCTEEIPVTLEAPEGVFVTTLLQDVTCYGDSDGVIIVDGEATGGSSPYMYALDGGVFNQFGLFGNLSPGSYDLIVQDANGCEATYTQSIQEPSELQVTIDVLGGDENLQLGDSVRLNAEIYTDTSNLQQLGWTKGSFWLDQGCDACLTRWIYPMETTLYEYLIVDENDCIGIDELLITVRKDRAVYIPNAFSPNGDGNNDIFYIHTGQEVASINIFKIYNRWGEVVYELNNFFANDPNQGWDGRFRGDFLNPGVFIYYAEVLFKDGRIELLKGDVMISK